MHTILLKVWDCLFICFSDPVMTCLIANLEATGSFQRHEQWVDIEQM